ncbi:MAG: glycosyl hydrolase-related protein, partial [Vibrionaceae bacterium]
SKSQHGAVLSVLKKAEDENALIVRFYNPSESASISDNLEFTAPVTSWQETQLDEKVIAGELETAAFGTLKPCQVKSFQVKF